MMSLHLFSLVYPEYYKLVCESMIYSLFGIGFEVAFANCDTRRSMSGDISNSFETFCNFCYAVTPQPFAKMIKLFIHL